MSINLDEIVDIFDMLGDWDQRYQYLVEMGEKLPFMPDKYKTDGNKVKGCMSQVWIHAYENPATPAIIHYHGDCDTSIIKGVLALLIQLLDGKTVEEIQSLDVDEFFTRLHLDENLSPSRHFGIYALLELMKKQARELKENNRPLLAH